MAHSLVVRRLRFHAGRALRCTVCSLGQEGMRAQQYSSVPGSDLCVTAAMEEKIKKSAGGGKKGIAEKLLAVVDKIQEMRLPPELRRGVGTSTANVDPSRLDFKGLQKFHGIHVGIRPILKQFSFHHHNVKYLE